MKEFLEQSGALRLQHPAVNAGVVVEALLKEVEHRPAAARLVILRPVVYGRDAGVDDGPGAHGAGLQGDVEGASGQPPPPQGAAGLGNGLELRVAQCGLGGLPPVV